MEANIFDTLKTLGNTLGQLKKEFDQYSTTELAKLSVEDRAKVESDPEYVKAIQELNRVMGRV